MSESKKESFVFYRSFYEAISDLTDKEQLEIYKAIAGYSLNFSCPELSGITGTIFKLIKPQIEANNKKFINGKKGASHGAKGGRPKTPRKPQENPSGVLTKNPIQTPNVNVNVNDNVNDNVNVSSVCAREDENENEKLEKEIEKEQDMLDGKFQNVFLGWLEFEDLKKRGMDLDEINNYAEQVQGKIDTGESNIKHTSRSYAFKIRSFWEFMRSKEKVEVPGTKKYSDYDLPKEFLDGLDPAGRKVFGLRPIESEE